MARVVTWGVEERNSERCPLREKERTKERTRYARQTNRKAHAGKKDMGGEKSVTLINK